MSSDPTAIPGDPDWGPITAALAAVGAEYLIAEAVEVFGAQAFLQDGSNAQTVVVLNVDGRFNKTPTKGSAHVMLPPEAALQFAMDIIAAVEVITRVRRATGEPL